MKTNRDFQKCQWLKEVNKITKKTPLRVLVILSQQPNETGSGIYLREITKELRKAGHKPHILAAHYRHLNASDFSGVNLKEISTVIFDNGKNSEISDINFPIPGMSLDMPYLHKPFHELSEEMLRHYFSVWANKIQAAINTTRPHLIHVNHLWILPLIVKSIVPWMPVVATYHGSEYNLLQKTPNFINFIAPGIQNLDVVMAISKDSAKQSQTHFGVLKRQTKIIGNGYNPLIFHVKKPNTLTRLLEKNQVTISWQKVVLYVGKFADYKGLPYLIRASELYTKNNSGVLTLIVGGGSTSVQASLKDMIDKLKLSQNVIMTGKIPYKKVGEVMNSADVFVLPSINEPFGLVFLEALACGIRGIAAKRGGPHFFVPKSLLRKKFVSLIKPLKLLDDKIIDKSDERRYINDLAKAIQIHLGAKTKLNERQYISHSVQDQTWEAKTKEITQVYFEAIYKRKLKSALFD